MPRKLYEEIRFVLCWYDYINYVLSLYFSSENAKGWATELTKILNRDEKFVLVTYLQLVGVCLYVFVKPELAPYIKGVLISEGILISHCWYIEPRNREKSLRLN